MPAHVERIPADVLNTVTLINCGGTINMSGAHGARPDDMVARSLAPVLRAQPVPVSVELTSPFPRPPDSSNLGETAWEVIRQTLSHEVRWRHAALDRLNQTQGAGVVITHGTDTMAITSLLVSLDLASARLRFPVLFTGAHATPDQPGSDAVANLTRAIALAGPAHRNTLPPGVFVVVGQDLHLASRLTKVETSPDSDGRYFFSYPAPIGQVAGHGSILKLESAFLETLQARPSPIPLVRTGRLGHVEHLVIDRFTDPRVLTDTEDRLARLAPSRATGLVLQGNFRASPRWPALSASIARLVHRGIVVAVGSRAVWQRLQSEAGSPEVCLIPRSLSHPAARLKLAWLLGTDRPREDLAADLETNLVGEVFETDALPDWIAYETYPDRLPGTEVVVVRPDLRRAALDDAVARLLDTPGRRRDLHLYGFGHGHIPGPNTSVAQLVQSWLAQTPLACDLEAAPDLWAVVDRLVAHLGTFDLPLLAEWICARYTLLAPGLRQAILRARARSRRTQLEASLHAHLRAALSAFESETGARLREPEAPVHAAAAAARWHDPAPPDPQALVALSDRQLLECLLRLDRAPIARRLVKDAVMAGSPLHAAVGEATDAGVRVHPRTQVTRGTPDPTRYEAGTLLVAVGAGGSGRQARPWQVRLLRPRRRLPPAADTPIVASVAGESDGSQRTPRA